MRMPRLRTILLTPVALFALLYIVAAIKLAADDDSIEVFTGTPAELGTIAILGASGTAGDGILKAALQSSAVSKIHVITRRTTPRMEEGVAAGKVQLTLHQDYLDYAAVQEQLAEVSTVFWAIGTSTVGVDEETYAMIHVDFPLQFVSEWRNATASPDILFHYISSSDISADSSMMWARQKVRAETELFKFAEGSKLRVIAYRPDYIGPTREEAHIGQTFLYWFFAPVKAAVKATQIGQAMIEVTARGAQFTNGDIIGTGGIIRYSDAYERRLN